MPKLKVQCGTEVAQKQEEPMAVRFSVSGTQGQFIDIEVINDVGMPVAGGYIGFFSIDL